LKTLLSGGGKKIKNPTGTKTKTIMHSALKKIVPFTNLVRKSDKNKHHASDMDEKIEFYMLHIPSKPPQFWSADFLQNYLLFTSNAGLNLIEGPSNETLVPKGGHMIFSFWTLDLGKSKMALASKIHNPRIRESSKNCHFLK